MDNQTRILIGALLFLTLIAAAIYLAPAVNERVFQPQVARALVAIEVAGTGIADVGVVAIESGTPFTLHAVLEATRRDGRPVYYTRAPGLRFRDETGAPLAPVAASAVQSWDRRGLVKVRWFTVEGRQPVLRLEDGQGIETLTFEPYFRADWPSNWSIPGLVAPAYDDRLSLGSRLPDAELDFGTQRYYVRVELYQDEKEVLARQRFASPGPDALRADPARFSTVVAGLSGAAGPASRVFGLTQIEPPPDPPASLRSGIRELVGHRLAFTQLSVLRDQLRGKGGESPAWLSVDLSAEPIWDQAVARGDLLRVGARVVVLYADRGAAGVLDYEDLCFDFAAGATVRALGDVFSGEDSVLEHLPLGR